jgi:DNA-directed RNA polymerase specialized sigma24 family protein
MADERLSGLLRADMLAEILKLLTAEEAVVAVLRLQGLPDAEIAAMLGLARSTVTTRMIEARKRIARELPEAASWLEGRQRRTGGGRRSDE